MSETQEAEKWMALALAEAEQAAKEDEVPVGAVVVRQGRLIGRGHDQRMALRDPTAHAEVLALRQAAETLGDWRLDGCSIYVTLEPCAMCAGAILLARIEALYFGAPNPKFGAAGSLVNLLADDIGWNHKVTTVGGILSHRCARLMETYFKAKRDKD